MAKAQLGTKRVCAECGTKFYDMEKDPIVCPKCNTVFQPVKLTRAEKAAASAIKPTEEIADLPAAEEDDTVLVSLEDAEAEQTATGAKGKLDVDGEDIDDEIEDSADDDDDDDTFLEEDDEDPDVSELIDGDIDEDEET